MRGGSEDGAAARREVNGRRFEKGATRRERQGRGGDNKRVRRPVREYDVTVGIGRGASLVARLGVGLERDLI